MKGNFNHLTTSVLHADNSEHKDKLIEILINEIDKTHDAHDKSKLTSHIYKCIFGDHLMPEYCDCFIKAVCGTSKWELSETNSAAAKVGIKFDNEPYTPEEFRVAMHLCYHTFNKALKENGNAVEASGWARLANAFLDSPSVGNLVEMYFNCKNESD